MKGVYSLIIFAAWFCLSGPLCAQICRDGYPFASARQLQFKKNFHEPLVFDQPAHKNFFRARNPFGEKLLFTSPPVSFDDTLPLPHKNYIRDDDPAFNKKYPVWVPMLEVPALNVLIWSFDRYVLDADYARISMETVKDNFKNGFEWDTDDFSTNFSLHPYTGSMYFNIARSNGYNFYESTPFVLGGSLMWELFMENSQPSYNDLINTTISGIFLGEVLYRLSSSVLDDRKTGGVRVFREILGTVLDPTRSFNRLLQGKTARVVQKEIYQKEPLSLTLNLGGLQANDGTNIGKGTISPMLNFNFIYGNPYEQRFRKAFDYFRLRMDFSFATPNNIVHNVIGEGFLFGKNADSSKKVNSLLGAFQHYDYWNTDSFEIGTIGFGGGYLSRVPVFRKGNFQNQLHLAVVPLGASNAEKIVSPDTINYNHESYTFSGGAELKAESALNFGWGEFAVEYYFYWLHTFVGKPSDNLLHILRPRLTFHVFKILNIGYEYLLYYRNDYYKDATSLHVRSGEQRVYLSFSFQNL